MKFYFLVGRTGILYGFTPSEKMARLFKSQKPGRTAWILEPAEMDGQDCKPDEEQVSKEPPVLPEPHIPKSHLFLPDTDTCLFCPCKKSDPAAAEPCEKAPPGAADFG